jgi:hypothetical protein
MLNIIGFSTVYDNVIRHKKIIWTFMEQISPQFKKVLSRYISYRGIDIVLYMRDGSVIELDKNRRIEGDYVIRNTKEGVSTKIELAHIQKAEFFAA